MLRLDKNRGSEQTESVYSRLHTSKFDSVKSPSHMGTIAKKAKPMFEESKQSSKLTKEEIQANLDECKQMVEQMVTLFGNYKAFSEEENQKNSEVIRSLQEQEKLLTVQLH